MSGTGVATRSGKVLCRLGLAASRTGQRLEGIARTLGPGLDLALRIWLGQIFLLSGLLKVADWTTAVLLATNEYPVFWLAPETAALLGAIVEVGGGALLIAGFCTRGAALAMACLSLVIQAEYVHFNEHVHWAILFAWFVVHGAGSISLDHLIARGAYSSAIPLASGFDRLFRAIERHLTPVYLLALRLFLAVLLLASPLGLDDWSGDPRILWYRLESPALPGAAPGALAAAAGIIIATAIIVGLSVRFIAFIWCLVLFAVAFSGAMDELGRINLIYLLVFLGLLVTHGAGWLSVDRKLEVWLASQLPAPLTGSALETAPQVVVVGAGFGGFAAARGLRSTPCSVTVIDQRNYHLFQPLLYQVATAGLSPADIATPIRELFRDQPNASVVMGRVTDIDRHRRQVIVGGRPIRFDYLVLATGARHAYFGQNDWERFAPGLKRIEDATEIRRRLLIAFEEAESTMDPTERRAFLTFVVVGGGPTGVELAGAIAELARHGLKGEFRHIDPSTARVSLVQAAARLLPTFPQALSTDAERALRALGVEILTSSRVEKIDERGVVVNGTQICARTVFWAAGVRASPAAKWLAAMADSSGRVVVGPDLSIPDDPDIFVIGDTALADAWNGKAVPGLAPAAKQAGRHVARVISAGIAGHPPPRPFRYRHRGNLATIGRSSAVADFGWLRLSGVPAWWLWGLVHIYFLAGVRNRLSVALEWFWAYLTFRRGTRLITGDQD